MSSEIDISDLRLVIEQNEVPFRNYPCLLKRIGLCCVIGKPRNHNSLIHFIYLVDLLNNSLRNLLVALEVKFLISKNGSEVDQIEIELVRQR
jgi:hypothetical protein